MLDICKTLFETWNSNCIKYCHWKSNEHLEEGLDGLTDLDVFVHPSHKSFVVDLLHQSVFLRCKTQASNFYPNVEEWLGFDRMTGNLVHLHLHFQIITGTKFCKEYVFPIDEKIIETRVIDESTGVYITDPNLELILLLSRIVLKAKNKRHIIIGNDYLKELYFLKQKIDLSALKELCKELIPTNWQVFYRYALTDVLNQEELHHLYIIVEKWLKQFRKYSRFHVFLRNRFYLYRTTFIQFFNRRFNCHLIDKKTFPQANMSICFIGQDGSGKSTLTQEICRWFNWKVSAERFYLGSGENFNSLLKRVLLKSVNHSAGSIKEPKEKHPKEEKLAPQSESIVRTIMLKGWTILRVKYLCSIAHRSYNEIKKAINYIHNGGIALYDRFPQIQFPGIYDGPKIRAQFKKQCQSCCIIRYYARMEEKWLTKSQSFQPSIVFKLILPPEESLKRKPFEDYDAIRLKSKITVQLEFTKSVVFEIDATQDYNKELLQIKTIIWKHLLEQCR